MDLFFSFLFDINNILRPAIIPCVLSNFILLLFLFYLNRREIKSFLAKIDKKTFLILTMIFLAGLTLRLILPSKQHILYIDEPWYINAAKNILATGQMDGSYVKSAGWPFILSISFALFGISNWVAIYASLVLGALTVILIFFLSFIIFENKTVSLIAAFFLAFLPLHIRWSASAETNVASLFFVVLAVLLSFLYFKSERSGKSSLFWLALVGILFSVQFRPENYILLFIFAISAFLFGKFPAITPKTILFSVLATVALSLPNFLRVLAFQLKTNWIESDSLGFMTGSNWGFSNLINNTINYGANLFNGKYEPLIFILLFIIGFFYLLKNDFRKGLFFSIWYFSFYFIYFFSWLQTLGARDRFFMSFYPITVLLAAFGFWSVTSLLISKFSRMPTRRFTCFLSGVVLGVLFIPATGDSSKLHANIFRLWETEIVELAERKIPAHCLIVARMPLILKSSTNLNVVGIDEFLRDEESGFNSSPCLLFFKDFYCYLPPHPNEPDCGKITSAYDLSLFNLEGAPIKEGAAGLGFYQISKKPINRP